MTARSLAPRRPSAATASLRITTILAKAFRATAFVIGGTLVLAGFFFIKLSGK